MTRIDFKKSGLSEVQVEQVAQDLAQKLKPGDCIVLDGEMGAGKSTFARFLLKALGIGEAHAGSPTFSIAHEYVSTFKDFSRMIHLDLYRLETEEELEAAGIESFFWEDDQALVLVEWLSRFPDFRAEVLKKDRCWTVQLDIDSEYLRSLTVRS